MKKLKISIIILIFLALLLAGIIFIINIPRIEININTTQNTANREEISNYIVFKSDDYNSIEDVVFYSKNSNIDDTVKNNLTIIANELKTKYPNKSILYLQNLGSAQLFDAKELYRCMQIVNGQKLDNTDMNVLIKEDGSIDIQFLIGCSWNTGNSIENIKISEEQAEQIVIDYLVKNPEDYKELRRGSFTSEVCTMELYKYNSKTSWKMQFLAGGSYIIIDANTGDILDKYFFCGIIVD